METIAKTFIVSGGVQGVGYRFFVERAANKLGIAGYVKNCSGGRVEVYAIANGPKLDSLKNELHRGPRMSRVTEVQEKDAEILRQYMDGFSIERD